ncbi:MAG: pitrilysin family protein [Candidatus Omnitrophota bacterium]
MYKTRLFLLFLLLNFTSVISYDQITVQAAESNVQLPALHIQEKNLANGLTLLIQENHSNELAAFEIIVKTGSIYENELQGSGIAHLTEHMLFKGTLNRPAGKIEEQVKFLGGSINGYTSHQFTGYTLVVPSQNTQAAIEILSDMLKNPLFDSNELIKEKAVILSEIQMNQDDPDRLLNQKFWQYSYPIAPYNLPVIGLEPIFTTLEQADLVKFYNKWYVPNNIIIAVSGDVASAEISQSLEKAFSDFKLKPYPQVTLPNIPLAQGIKSYIIAFDVNVSQMIIGLPSVVLTHPDSAALDIIATILGQGDSALLHNKLVRKQKLAYSVSVYNYTPGFRGIFAVSCALDAVNQEKVLKEIFKEFEMLKIKKISKQQIEKAKNLYLSDYFSNQQTVESQAQAMATDYAYTGDVNFTCNYLNQLAKLTPVDIQNCAKKYLNKENYVSVILEPITAAAQQEKTEIKPDGEIKEITFDNGLRLVLKKNAAQPIISLGLAVGGGTRWEDDKDNGVFNLLSNLLIKGTKKRSAEDIAQTLDYLGASVSTFSGYNSFGLKLDCLSKDIETGIDVFSDLIINSTFVQPEIAQAKRLVQKEIDIQNDNIFRDTFNRTRETLFNSYPYRFNNIGQTQSVNQIDREMLLAKKDAFLIAPNMVITIFGDFDEQGVIQMIKAKIIKVVKTGKMPIAPVFNEQAKEQQQLVENKRDKQQAILMLAFPGCDIFSQDRQGLEFLNDLLIAPGSVLYERIREKAGLSYTMGGSAITGLDTGFFYLYVATAPEALSEVKNIVIEEINKAKDELFSSGIIDSTKNYLIGTSKLSRQANSSLGFIVGLDVLYGLGIDYHQNLDQRISELNAEKIKRIANKYLDWNKSVMVITKDRFND